MKKTLLFYLILCFAAAVALGAVLSIDYSGHASYLRSLQNDLSVSRTKWESIAAEKESLQEEYSEVSDAVREAELTIEEENARSKQLSEEISGLEADIVDLKEQIEKLNGQD